MKKNCLMCHRSNFSRYKGSGICKFCIASCHESCYCCCSSPSIGSQAFCDNCIRKIHPRCHAFAPCEDSSNFNCCVNIGKVNEEGFITSLKHEHKLQKEKEQAECQICSCLNYLYNCLHFSTANPKEYHCFRNNLCIHKNPEKINFNDNNFCNSVPLIFESGKSDKISEQSSLPCTWCTKSFSSPYVQYNPKNNTCHCKPENHPTSKKPMDLQRELNSKSNPYRKHSEYCANASENGNLKCCNTFIGQPTEIKEDLSVNKCSVTKLSHVQHGNNYTQDTCCSDCVDGNSEKQEIEIQSILTEININTIPSASLSQSEISDNYSLKDSLDTKNFVYPTKLSTDNHNENSTSNTDSEIESKCCNKSTLNEFFDVNISSKRNDVYSQIKFNPLPTQSLFDSSADEPDLSLQIQDSNFKMKSKFTPEFHCESLICFPDSYYLSTDNNSSILENVYTKNMFIARKENNQQTTQDNIKSHFLQNKLIVQPYQLPASSFGISKTYSFSLKQISEKIKTYLRKMNKVRKLLLHKEREFSLHRKIKHMPKQLPLSDRFLQELTKNSNCADDTDSSYSGLDRKVVHVSLEKLRIAIDQLNSESLEDIFMVISNSEKISMMK